ncbi:hypothetical protein GCM10022240_05160 [Microbacterium kribbense]|uniref:HTH marR-type domain-containing protein n=1 Tax=Microbacterium kribbense TaxID=433645 RepID=A0ABP7G5P1_9MICO
MTETPDAAGDPAEIIAAALARLRGRRGPQPSDADPPGWDGSRAGRFAHGGPHHPPGHGGPFGHGDPDASRFGGSSGMHSGHGPWGGGRFAGPARLRVLEALAAASAPLTVGEIGAQIGVDQPRASRLVQQCAEHGLVSREADPGDARRTLIVLTDRGAAIMRRFRGDRRAAVESALADFTEAEKADLARLLGKLADGWPR